MLNFKTLEVFNFAGIQCCNSVILKFFVDVLQSFAKMAKNHKIQLPTDFNTFKSYIHYKPIFCHEVALDV